MEAKDTVIKKKWMSKEVANDQNALLREQAEISFKAGRDEERKNTLNTAQDVLSALEGGRKAGIKEVVEWGDGKCPHCIGWNVKSRKKCEICWQAKLKDWHISA